MKEPFGYLRKAKEAWAQNLTVQKKNNFQYALEASLFFVHAKNAVKFVLPENGRIFDTKFKALPTSLNLPYEKIVIEYFCDASGGLAEQVFGGLATVSAPKRIVYAEQTSKGIIVESAVAFRIQGKDQWQVLPFVAQILCDEHLKIGESISKPIEAADNEIIKGVYTKFADMGGKAEQMFADDWEKHAYTDMFDEVSAVLSLLEALACKNVGIEKIPTRKMNKSASKRGALPFDEYHILTVTTNSGASSLGSSGSHRSPREHLRRGHIRRLNSGNIWVNSTVVNAGNHGKIQKIYELEAA